MVGCREKEWRTDLPMLLRLDHLRVSSQKDIASLTVNRRVVGESQMMIGAGVGADVGRQASKPFDPFQEAHRGVEAAKPR